MLILTPHNWKDYELIDSGNGQRLERFGRYTLVRPDPQIIWKPSLQQHDWEKADAIFKRTSGDRGEWINGNNLPDKWVLRYNYISFYCKLSPFKHTGVFPEQAVHWDFIHNSISNASTSLSKYSLSEPEANRSASLNILNLFGYTGIASLVAAQAGAKVTHVDASYPTIGWGQENQELSRLQDAPIRWILDDALKFCQREIKRGVKYDGIIMDPPVFGHGPKGEVWDFNESFPKLMEVCMQLLSDKPLFIIINAYAISTSAITLENVLKGYTNHLEGTLESGELVLQETGSQKRLLSTGIFTRWSSENI